MTTQLPPSTERYESQVRLTRVTRQATRDELHDWTVHVLLVGNLAPLQQAELTRPLASNVIKGTVHTLAQQTKATSLEAFAEELLNLFFHQAPQLTSATVTVHSHLWKRLSLEAGPCPTAFMKGSSEYQTAKVHRDHAGTLERYGGFADMTLLRTAQPGPPDSSQHQHNAPQPPRPQAFRATLAADWHILSTPRGATCDFLSERHRLREHIITTFAHHPAPNTRDMLTAMAEAAFQDSEAISEIVLRLKGAQPRLLEHSGSNPNSPALLFMPDQDPHTLEVTVTRP